MSIDIKFVTESDTASRQHLNATLYLKVDSWTYLIDREIKQYNMAMLKSIATAIGGKTWGTVVTDFGQCTETVRLTGTINEAGTSPGERLLKNRQKMMEISKFVRINGFESERTYLFIGNEFNNQDGSRATLDSSSDGMEGKIAKIQFEWKKGYAIMFSIDFVVGYDFEA